MKLLEFLRIFPNASRDDLAAITGLSVRSIDPWFYRAGSEAARTPSRQVEIIFELYVELQTCRTQLQSSQQRFAEYEQRQGFGTQDLSRSRPQPR